MYVCMSVCLYVCMYVCMYVYIYIYVQHSSMNPKDLPFSIFAVVPTMSDDFGGLDLRVKIWKLCLLRCCIFGKNHGF